MTKRGPGSGPSGDPMRRLVLERTHRLLQLDAILRDRGEPGVLQRSEAELQLLEERELGSAGAPVAAPSMPTAPTVSNLPGPNALTDVERRAWVRRHLIVIPGGVS